jgi:DNA polymerase III alpha subunit
MIEDGHIAMGLSSINGLGDAAYKEVTEKGFATMTKDEFFAVKLKKFNKTSFEASLKAGVYDDWSNSREEILAWRKAKVKNTMQMDIFGNYGIETATATRRFVATTDEQKYSEFLAVCNLDLRLLEKISDLKKMFFEQYKVEIEPFTNFDDDRRFYYFRLHGVEERTSQKGNKFYSVAISDGAVVRRLTMWRDVYAKLKDVMTPGAFYVTKFVKDKGWLSFNATAPFRKVF